MKHKLTPKIIPVFPSGNVKKEECVRNFDPAIAQIQDKAETDALTIFMLAPVAICSVKGENHTVTLANDAFLQLIEKGKDFVGKPFFESLQELKTQGLKELFDSAILDGTPNDGHVLKVTLIRNRKRQPGFYNFVYHPIRKQDRTVTGIVLVVNDVTENKNLENQQVREKELEKNGEQLIQNNKTLKEKNEELVKINAELEAFSSVSSHDLQEPLRKIQIFAGRILEKESMLLSDSGKDYFQRIQNAAERMRQLILDLLTFSLLNSAERKFETTDLSLIVEEVKNEFKETIQEKHATIEANGMCKVPIIPFQFRQLLFNLIGNSLKFSMPEKPLRIIIKSNISQGSKLNNDQLSPEKKYCHISISDNGIGFDPQYKNQIFEVFQRLHGKDEFKGTGIGLAIVKKIVENHSGVITATGEKDKGATFDIYFPALTVSNPILH